MNINNNPNNDDDNNLMIQENVSLKPGIQWTSLLLESNLIQLIFTLQSLLESINNVNYQQQKHIVNIQVINIKILIQLASLKGKIYKNQLNIKYNYYLELINGTINLLTNCWNKILDPSLHKNHELLDLYGIKILEICSLSNRIISSLSLKELLTINQLSNNLILTKFLDIIAKISCVLLNADFEDSILTWTSEAYELLISLWVLLIEPIDIHQLSNDDLNYCKTLLSSYTSTIFAHYLSQRIRMGIKEVLSDHEIYDQFDDKAYLDDQLQSLALIGRINIQHSLDLLYNELNGYYNLLLQYISSLDVSILPHSSIEVVLESLYWIIQLLVNILADDYNGIIPMIPHNILYISSTSNIVKQCIELLLKLCQNEINILTNSNKHNKPNYLSPFLAMTLTKQITRFCASYLYIDLTLYKSSVANNLIINYAANTSLSKQILILILKYCYTHLSLWNEEEELCDLTCDLLLMLCNTKSIRNELISLSAWWDIIILIKNDLNLDTSIKKSIKQVLSFEILTKLFKCSILCINNDNSKQFETLILSSIINFLQYYTTIDLKRLKIPINFYHKYNDFIYINNYSYIIII